MWIKGISAFRKYIDGVPFADISKARLDSTSYELLRIVILVRVIVKEQLKNLTNYITKYPKGVFAFGMPIFIGAGLWV